MNNISRHNKLFWGSSYDRGLNILLIMWSDIKKSFPNATLDICYGWNLFDKAYADNQERQRWKEDVSNLMNQDGITHHGRVGQERLREIRKECGIWAYPTYFTEIFCITAIESQLDGLVPVTMTLGALKETAEKGILIDKDIYSKEGQEEYLAKLLELMGDRPQWKKLSGQCKKFARKFDWESIGGDWLEEFTSQPIDGKISVYTPTIRDGFWNIMASNLAAQKHSNLEWIIVDGQKDSRESTAKKYAEEYELDIKYIHQGQTKRTYGLANANNLAIEAASGELFVFLQDFTLLTPTGLEELLNVSRKHPGDFIAPVDTLFEMKIVPNLENKEDWFNNNLEVIGPFIQRNIRIQNRGIRLSDSITDFEQNFGAVPLATLKELGGYWEFFDNGMGYDDTEIVHRANKLGYRIWVDDTNQCVCLDHEPIVGNNEQGVPRLRMKNTPRYAWMIEQMNKGLLPIIRDPKIDKIINLEYEVPEEISDENSEGWVDKNLNSIITSWGDTSNED